MNPQRFPLSWPDGWPKPPRRERARFTGYSSQSSAGGGTWKRARQHTIAEGRTFLAIELERLGATDALISSNLRTRVDGEPVSGQAEPGDPSIAVYFRLRNRPQVLACGKWDRAADNLWAIGKHVESLRGQARWGVGSIEQAFRGYTALPGPGEAGGLSWWEILGVPINASEEQIRDAYRALGKKLHPDAGGDAEAFNRVAEAYRMATSQKPGPR